MEHSLDLKTSRINHRDLNDDSRLYTSYRNNHKAEEDEDVEEEAAEGDDYHQEHSK